jgi:phage terminase large subunit
MDVCADISPKLGFLAKPARYKVIYGGRGAGRSWACAIVLLIKCLNKKHRILCAREFQNSISESVHTVLSLQIERLGLQNYFDIQQTSIRCIRTGAEFIFAGLRHNINKIKSMEGITIVWCEEAQTISKASWDTLIPTIREAGSEIWVTFNPELDTDETYKRFVLNAPTNAVVCKINWHDNPWFPDVLKQEKDDLKALDYDAYLNVWEGHCRQSVDGAVYAKEIRQAMSDGRVTKVLPIANKPVETFWDLGKRDHTAIWFAQINMGEYRILDFYQNRGQDLPHYFEEIAKRKYRLGTIWLPHDATQDRLTGSIDRVIRAAYPNNTVRVIPRMAKKAIGIEAVRGIFPYCVFDEEKCADGLQALRRFRFDVDASTGQYSKDPLHDENSDAADALAQMALSLKENKPKPQVKQVEVSRFGGIMQGLGWMG